MSRVLIFATDIRDFGFVEQNLTSAKVEGEAQFPVPNRVNGSYPNLDVGWVKNLLCHDLVFSSARSAPGFGCRHSPAHGEHLLLLTMLRQTVNELNIATRGRGLYEVTSQVSALVAQSGLHNGLATLHVRHTSASLLIQENADPGVRRDLERFFARLVPDGDPLFQHTIEGADDMPAHVRTALTAVNLSIPIVDGGLALGTWQGIYLWEHRQASHHRQIVVHLLGE